ncbi:YybH family protein [Planococcus sp. CAU13]|uniref:YybH family protein n=1 Tax=Planococcus sp. CAU13 TaxID=1541197 RepID=UPI00052FF892|nr:nuclear transport factor 2 family protein [Planococcus sp. CAU13]
MTEKFHEVQDVLDTYKTALHEKDADKLLSLYDSDIQIFDCWGAWESKGIAAWKENVAEWFNGLDKEGILLEVTFNDTVIEETASLAFVHSAVAYAGYDKESGEKLRQMTNRFTFGLKKQEESWVITHEHSSLPIDMETGKGIFDLK